MKHDLSISKVTGTSPANKTLFRSLTGPSAMIGLLSCFIFFKHDLNASLELHPDRPFLTQGWRLFTAHLTHWDIAHFLWDTLIFTALGIYLESGLRQKAKGRKDNANACMVWQLLASGLAISLAVMIYRPDLSSYRGLSGLNAMLLTALLCKAIDDNWSKRNRIYLWPLLGLFLFICQTIYLHITGNMLFVSDHGNYEPLALAHGVGILCGVLFSPLLPRNLPGDVRRQFLDRNRP